MIRVLFVLLLIITGNFLFAQHIQYKEKDKPKAEVVKVKPVKDSVVFHDWPDRCPALSGAVPVLNNYVPPLIVKKVTEVYKGHLYSITTVKVTTEKVEYKLKVCVKGIIRYDFANEDGVIITK